MQVTCICGATYSCLTRRHSAGLRIPVLQAGHFQRAWLPVAPIVAVVWHRATHWRGRECARGWRPAVNARRWPDPEEHAKAPAREGKKEECARPSPGSVG